MVSMNTYRIWCKINQFTEIPILLKNVDERLAWTRYWTSWRSLQIENFKLYHIKNENTEAVTRESGLLTEEYVTYTDVVGATTKAYELIRTKLNILSLVSERGFSISMVYPVTDKEPAIDISIQDYLEQAEKALVGNEPNVSDSPPHHILSELVMTAGVEHSDILKENLELVQFIEEANLVERNIVVNRIVEVEDEWKSGYYAFRLLTLNQQNRLNQSMDFYRNTLLSRDIFSRFLLSWTALDSLTPYLDKMGNVKVEGISSFLGNISGLNKLEDTISKLYSIRNDISHNRRRKDPEFISEAKRGLLMLEWILKNYLRKRLGLEQKDPKALPDIS